MAIPEPPPTPSTSLLRRIFENHLIAWGVAIVAVLAAIGSATADLGGGDAAPVVESGEAAEETPSPTTSPTATETEDPPASPDPDAGYTSNCDYVLGDFTENPKTGYRFIAGAEIDNTGNIGVEAELRASWEQLGTNPIRESKSVEIEAGRTKSLQITVPVGQDEIDLHQSANGRCKAVVVLVDTFGEVEE